MRDQENITVELVEEIEDQHTRNLFAQTAVEIWDLETATLNDAPYSSRYALSVLGEFGEEF